MTPSEAEGFVLDLLRREGPMTTAEIDRTAAEESRKCPDQTVLFLTKMKRKGMIKGEVSHEKRGWLWSLP